MSDGLSPVRRAELRERALDALFALPEQIDRYQIRGLLGRGGMGVVYDAFDPRLGRRVALKVIDAERLGDVAADRDLQQRFEREMRATSQLFHPNLIAILDAGIADIASVPSAYYVMERIEGESLESRLQRAGALSRSSALEVALALARGLARVHEEGLVHRDLKPSNVLLPEGGPPKLTDFGLCQLRQEPTETKILGSAHYLAPEQVTGAQVDARSDLFGLGGILVQMFTAKAPFPASSLSEHLVRIVSGEPEGLAHLDRDVRELARTLLAKDPGDRPESAEWVARRLESLTSRNRPGQLWRRALAGSAVAVILIAAGVTTWGLSARSTLQRLEGEVRIRSERLAVQIDRARALTPALATLVDSATEEERRALRDEITGTLNRLALERRRFDESSRALETHRYAWPWGGHTQPREDPTTLELQGRLLESEHWKLLDPEGALDTQEAAEVEEQLRLIERELDVDARVLFWNRGDLSPFEVGTRSFEALESFAPSGRGLLIVLDPEPARASLQVGYALEPIVTDARAGALARAHLAAAAGGSETGLEIRLALRSLRERLRTGLRSGELELFVDAWSGVGPAAGGAGASAVAAASTKDPPLPLNLEERAGFRAGADPIDAYERYRTWLAEGRYDLDVGVLSLESRRLLAGVRRSAVYLREMSDTHPAGRVGVIERGDRALLYALEDPLAPPHFLRRREDGWQIDLASREHHVLPIAGGAYSWTLREIDAGALQRFRDQLAVVEGWIRILGGDNRTLPESPLRS